MINNREKLVQFSRKIVEERRADFIDIEEL